MDTVKQTPKQLSAGTLSKPWILVLLTGQTFFYALTLSLLEIAGTALFLVDFGAEKLPYVYLAIALFVSLLSYGYTQLQKQWPLTQVSTTAVLSFGMFCFLAWLGLIGPGWRWISFALMVIFALGYQMIFVVVGGQAGRLFDVRQMKRLFPIVLTGFTVGFMAGGLILPLLTRLLPRTENLLLVAATSMLLGLLLLRLTIYRFGPMLTQTAHTPSQRPALSLPQLLHKPYIRSIFLYQMLSAAGTQLILFIFLDQTALIFPAVEDLAQFFGRFTIALNLLLILFLATPAGFLLNRFGLRLGLTANPGVIALIVVIMLGVGIPLGEGIRLLFWLAVGGRILDIMLSIGTTAPAIKATYQALPPSERPIVETAVEGIGVPIAFGLTGLILLLFNTVSGFTFAFLVIFTAVVTAFWFTAGVRVYRRYGHALQHALRRRFLDETTLTLADGSSLAVIERFLQRNTVSDVRLALDVLEAADHKSVDPHLIRLVEHVEPTIRSEALLRIERRRVAMALLTVKARLQAESDPTVKGAALQALCALTEAENVEAIIPYLDDQNPDVRLGAMVGLLRYGSIPGILAAGQRLAALETATDPDERAFAAQVVGQAGLASFYQPLVALLTDEYLSVRRAALLASGNLGHARLTHRIIDNLAHPALRSTAMSALIASGEACLPVIEQGLAGHTTYDSAVIHRLIRATAQINSERAITLFKRHVNHPDNELQNQILLALSRCGYRAATAEIDQIEAALNDQAHAGARILLAKQDLGQDEAVIPLQTALDDALSQVQQHVFLLLSFIHDPRMLRQAMDRLAHGEESEQALVIETLDIALAGAHKRLVLALVDGSMSLQQRVKMLGATVAHLKRDECLQKIIGDTALWPHPWIRACAIYAAGKLAYKTQVPVIESSLCIPDPHIQETATWALNVLASEADKSKQIVEASMLLTIEKVAILKSVNIFADTPNDVLASIAAITDEVYPQPDETFIIEGDLGDCMYVIIEGEVRVHTSTGSGPNQKTIMTLGPGQSVGELAVLDPEPRAASVTSVGESWLFRIDKDAFAEVMADRPEITGGVVRALCQRIRALA